MFKRLLLAALLVSLPAGLSAEGPSVRGTLPEDYIPSLEPILRAAVERSPRTIQASVDLAEKEGERYTRAAALWPQLNGNADYAVNTAQQSHYNASTGRGFFYYVGVTQPVFQWGAYRNNAQIGRLGTKIAERQYAEAYRQLAKDLRAQYLQLIAKRINLRNIRYAEKQAKDALAVVKSRIAAGAGTSAEEGLADISLQEASLAADRAEEDYGYAKRVFMRLSGVDDLVDDSIPLMVPHPEFKAEMADQVLKGFLGEGIDHTFQSQIFDMLIRQQELSYAIAKVKLLPKVNLGASYNVSNNTVPSGNTVNQYAVSSENYNVTANWNIFDGFAGKGDKLVALELKRSFELQKKNASDGMVDQIEHLRQDLGLVSRAMGLAEVHHALVEAEVNRRKQDVSLGITAQAAVDQVLSDFYYQDYLMASARGSYLTDWTEFISLAGIDPALNNISARYVK